MRFELADKKKLRFNYFFKKCVPLFPSRAKRAFSNGKFFYKLTAAGLKLVDKGFYYEGWLEKDGNNLSVGRLELDTAGNGVLYYTASQDRSDYNRTVITLEPEDGNPEPATPILEGNF